MTCTSCSQYLTALSPDEETLLISEISVSIDGYVNVTCIGHGLANGDTVLISDSNCSPDIDGYWTVIVIDTDTFAIRTSSVAIAGDYGLLKKNPSLGRLCLLATSTLPGGYTYCGCYCANCCPGEIIYEPFNQSFNNCMINGSDIFDVTCRTSLPISGIYTNQAIKDIPEADCADEELVPDMDFSLEPGDFWEDCDALQDLYSTWKNDWTAIIDDGVYTECGKIFLKSLFPEAGDIKKYFCCNRVQTQISFTAAGYGCCLDNQFTNNPNELLIRQKFIYATGNLNVLVNASFIDQQIPCMITKAEQAEEPPPEPACPLQFVVTTYTNIYVPELPVGSYQEPCYAEIRLSCNNDPSYNSVSFQFYLPNCDAVFLDTWGSNAPEGTGDPADCGTLIGGVASDCGNAGSGGDFTKMISQNVSISPICFIEPAPAYWSGTIDSKISDAVSVLSSDLDKNKGLIQFDNHITKSIKTIYLSKQNYLKEQRTFKFEDWNDLGQTKKTHLKIKYGKNKIICIFKITDEIKEFGDFYEIPVKFVYGKLPPDGILINLEFILPSKTTSHLTKINKLEILKRIKRRRT